VRGVGYTKAVLAAGASLPGLPASIATQTLLREF
jgi:hypothetical protein